MEILKKILVIFASVLFTFVLCEIGFRIVVHFDAVPYPKPDQASIVHRYSADKDLVYELKPDWTSEDGLIQTNSWGMRDYEYSLAKPVGVQRIAVVGDSVAFGYGEGLDHIPLEDTFAKLLESKLNSHSSQKYEVLNFSVTGYNSSQEQRLVENKVVGFDPDVILVCYVPNDDLYPDGLGELTRATSPYSLGSRLNSKLISYLLLIYERAMFPGSDDITRVWDLFDTLQSLSEEHGFEVVILMTPYEDTLASYDQKHELVKERAGSYGFGVIDPKESWKSQTLEFRRALYDALGTHYSSRGMHEVADMLFDYFTGGVALDPEEE